MYQRINIVNANVRELQKLSGNLVVRNSLHCSLFTVIYRTKVQKFKLIFFNRTTSSSNSTKRTMRPKQMYLYNPEVLQASSRTFKYRTSRIVVFSLEQFQQYERKTVNLGRPFTKYHNTLTWTMPRSN
jgi:hypothetical protein